MAKYYGKIGYGETVETTPGVWENTITERTVYGETIKNSRRLDSGQDLNDDISVSIRVSFIADPYALQNFHLIKYATYMNQKWKVSLVEVNHPRLELTLGGIFNG